MKLAKSFGSLAAVCLVLGVSVAAAETVSVDLGVTPADPMNVFQITVTADISGTEVFDTDTSTVTGNILADLGMAFSPATHDVTSIDELEFTGGTLLFSDLSFTLDFSIFGTLEASGTGIQGTLDTPAPPGTVVGGSFGTEEHLLVLNQGTFSAYGTGALAALFDPITIDLADEPLAATTESTGSVAASLTSLVGDLATYDVELTMPVDFEETLLEDEEHSISVNVAAVGTLESAGQFTQIVPEPATISLVLSLAFCATLGLLLRRTRARLTIPTRG